MEVPSGKMRTKACVRALVIPVPSRETLEKIPDVAVLSLLGCDMGMVRIPISY